MEDYSESSSVRMEREMMRQQEHDHSSSNATPTTAEEEEDHTSNSVMEDSSNNSLAAFDNEIRRMTRDADKILNDIRSESSTTPSQHHPPRKQRPVTIIPEDDDNDDDTVGDDASLKGELERLDLVSMEIRKSLETTPKTAASPWKFPPKQKPAEPAPNLQAINIVVWGVVLYLMVHASYRLVDNDGYLRLLL